MRRISVIGIGPGDPEQVTVQAIRVLNTADVIFMADPGEGQPDQVDEWISAHAEPFYIRT